MGLISIRATRSLVTQNNVAEFRIAGYRDGFLLGKWDKATRDDDDSWFLNFDPSVREFMIPGDMGLGVSQAWNANGNADDCGNPGFGFNPGNFAQDFCVSGRWVEESGMPPETLFVVSPIPVDSLCRVYAPTS